MIPKCPDKILMLMEKRRRPARCPERDTEAKGCPHALGLHLFRATLPRRPPEGPPASGPVRNILVDIDLDPISNDRPPSLQKALQAGIARKPLAIDLDLLWRL